MGDPDKKPHKPGSHGFRFYLQHGLLSSIYPVHLLSMAKALLTRSDNTIKHTLDLAQKKEEEDDADEEEGHDEEQPRVQGEQKEEQEKVQEEGEGALAVPEQSIEDQDRPSHHHHPRPNFSGNILYDLPMDLFRTVLDLLSRADMYFLAQAFRPLAHVINSHVNHRDRGLTYTDLYTILNTMSNSRPDTYPCERCLVLHTMRAPDADDDDSQPQHHHDSYVARHPHLALDEVGQAVVRFSRQADFVWAHMLPKYLRRLGTPGLLDKKQLERLVYLAEPRMSTARDLVPPGRYPAAIFDEQAPEPVFRCKQALIRRFDRAGGWGVAAAAAVSADQLRILQESKFTVSRMIGPSLWMAMVTEAVRVYGFADRSKFVGRYSLCKHLYCELPLAHIVGTGVYLRGAEQHRPTPLDVYLNPLDPLSYERVQGSCHFCTREFMIEVRPLADGLHRRLITTTWLDYGPPGAPLALIERDQMDPDANPEGFRSGPYGYLFGPPGSVRKMWEERGNTRHSTVPGFEWIRNPYEQHIT